MLDSNTLRSFCFGSAIFFFVKIKIMKNKMQRTFRCWWNVAKMRKNVRAVLINDPSNQKCYLSTSRCNFTIFPSGGISLLWHLKKRFYNLIMSGCLHFFFVKVNQSNLRDYLKIGLVPSHIQHTQEASAWGYMLPCGQTNKNSSHDSSRKFTRLR